MEDDEEVTGEHVSLENLLKDLEKQTNFDEFLPYNESKKREMQEDDLLPSPFSPTTNYRENSKSSGQRKLIIPLRSLPSSNEKKSIGSNFFTFQKKALSEMMRTQKTTKKLTKVEEIMNLQEEGSTFNRKNMKKILPKINKKVGHSINGLLSLL